VPSAEGYPYTRALFTNDGTGRVKEQAGVGATHSLKGGKTVRTFYGNPTESELLQLFGVETPLASSVQKIITYDANGTGSVAYKTKDGKVIATGIIYSGPTGPLDKPDESKHAMIDEVTGNIRLDENTVVSRKPLFFSLPLHNSIQVDYEIDPTLLKELCGDVNGSLIGHYPLDKNANDYSGKGNNASVVGTTNQNDNFGAFSYRLNGTSDYLKIPDDEDFDFGADDFTISYWVKVDPLNTGTAGIGKWNSYTVSGTNEWSLSLKTPNGVPGFSIEVDNTIYTAEAQSNLSSEGWYHLVGVRSGGELKFYIDGQPKGTKAIVATAKVNDKGLPVYIGRTDGNNNFTKADFDEVQIYSRALDASEVNTLFHRGGPICKSCDYKISFKLYRDDDPNLPQPGTIPAPLMVTGGECAQASTTTSSFTIDELLGGVNYVLEKRIEIANKNSVTSKLWIDEHVDELLTFYKNQQNAILAPITSKANDLKALYTYLAGEVTAQRASYDAVNKQYIIPLGAEPGSCPEFIFIPKVDLCEPTESFDSNCKRVTEVNGVPQAQTFTEYFQSYITAQKPDFVFTSGNGQSIKLTYAFFKNRYNNTDQYFTAAQFDAMMVNLLADNAASQNFTCEIIWKLWKSEVAAYLGRSEGNINSDGDNPIDATDFPQQTKPGENNIYENFISAVEQKLRQDKVDRETELNTTIDICATPPTGYTWFIKKTDFYGNLTIEVGGSSVTYPTTPDLIHAYRQIYYDQDNVYMQKIYQNVMSSSGNLSCKRSDFYNSTRYGDFDLSDDEVTAKRDRVLGEIKTQCGEACESRAESFRQAIIQSIFTNNPNAKIEHYRMNQSEFLYSSNNVKKYVAVLDLTVNNGIAVDYTECEIDAMVFAAVQKCKTGYCNVTLTANQDGSFGTASEWSKIRQAILANFDLKVNTVTSVCSAPNTVNPINTPVTYDTDITRGFKWGDILGAPSNPPDFDAVFTVTNNNSNGTGSFSQILQDASSYSVSYPYKTKLIRFSISGVVPITINTGIISGWDYHLQADGLTNTVIDATTQPGFSSLHGPAISIRMNNGSGNLLINNSQNVLIKGFEFISTGASSLPLLKISASTAVGSSGYYSNIKVFGNVFRSLTSSTDRGISVDGFSGSNLASLNGGIFIEGNVFGASYNLQNSIPLEIGLYLQSGTNIVIGGNSIRQSNVFFSDIGVDHLSCNDVKIVNNRFVKYSSNAITGSYYSSSKIYARQNLATYGSFDFIPRSSHRYIYYYPYNSQFDKSGIPLDLIPAPVITSVNRGCYGRVTGTAMPGSIIDIFMERASIDGKEDVVPYLGSTIADADGNWYKNNLSLIGGFNIAITASHPDYSTSALVKANTPENPPALDYTLCFEFTTDPGNITVPDGVEIYNPHEVTCAQASSSALLASIDHQVTQILSNREQSFRAQYKTCADPSRIRDKMTVSYASDIHQYTLYYYDRAGNLVRTVPPQGVSLLPVVTPQDIIDARGAVPTHTMVTEYHYNTLGQLIREHTPDANALTGKLGNTATEDQLNGLPYYSTFIYSDIGQLRFSQNAKQKAENTYSYTHYDELGRVVEVGEAKNFNLDKLNKNRNNEDASFPLRADVRQITHTIYNEPCVDDPDDINDILPPGYTQEFLRNRVSYTYLDEDGSDATLIDRVYTAYSYDTHGNVKWLVQKIPGLLPIAIEYDYDLISGKVLQVSYNPGKEDEFYHKYKYDANNRVTSVSTSKDGNLWERDASYEYYLHGPLKRTQIGEDLLQGLDYTYTINGWLKGINHPSLTFASDPIDPNKINDPLKPLRPKDGYSDISTNATLSSQVGKDAFGMALTYFAGDYTRDGSFFDVSTAGHNTAQPLTGRSLYNGNIAAWTTNMQYPVSASVKYKGRVENAYTYDELNRIKSQQMVQNGLPINDYKSSYKYDKNGNIESQTNTGYNNLNLDDLTYHYYDGTNKLSHVTEGEGVIQTAFDKDMESQAAGNYSYDAIGNLTRDADQHIKSITWTPYGKVKKVQKWKDDDENLDGAYTEFLYDATGNRVLKKQLQPGGLTTYNYYVRDASGNVMAVYNKDVPLGSTTGELKLIEVSLYGSDRVGMYIKPVGIGLQYAEEPLLPEEVRVTADATKTAYEELSYLVNPGATITLDAGFQFSSSSQNGTEFNVRVAGLNNEPQSDGLFTRHLNSRHYELKDHLGNVRTTITDLKFSQWSSTEGVFKNFTANVTGTYNYYAFGMDQPERTWNSGGKYRYGFNGKEKDDNGEWGTTAYDYGFRIYNPALARFLSVDPLMKRYPMLTPYQFASNSPISSIDLDGKEGLLFLEGMEEMIFGTNHIRKVEQGAVKRAVESVKGSIDGFGAALNVAKFLANSSPTKLATGGDYSETTYLVEVMTAMAHESTQKLIDDYKGLVSRASDGDEEAIGALAFEIVMLAVEVDDLKNLKALKTKGTRTLADIEAEVSNGGARIVNHQKGDMNCAGCAEAGDATLKGNPATALNHGVTTTDDVLKSFGKKAWSVNNTSTRIKQRMKDLGDGASGIVFGYRGPGDVGHYFNVVNKGGKVMFFDFQKKGSPIMKASELKEFKDLWMINTTKSK
jgi:RHS repeat-associated protein